MATKLTYAQAETLAALYSAHCIDGFGYFDPIRVFPARNNADNGHRRTCRSLAKKGLLTEAGLPEHQIQGQRRSLQRRLGRVAAEESRR